MRKLLIVIAVLALFAVSCKKDIGYQQEQIPEFTSDPIPICILGNCWTSLTAFPATLSGIEGVFVVNGIAYLSHQSFGPTPTFLWSYDGSSWSQTPHPTTPQQVAELMFTVGNKGYSLFSNYQPTSDWSLQEFDPATGWTAKAPFPGGSDHTPEYGKSVFVIGTKAYITSYNYNLQVLELWQYDQVANTWTKKANVPKPSGTMPIDFAFALGGKGYILFRVTQQQSITLPPSTNLFYSYDPATNLWTAKGSYPGDRRVDVTGFVVGNYAYVGTGKNAFVALPTASFKKYDATTNTWSDIASYAGGATHNAIGFTMGSRGYLLDFYNMSLPSGSNYFYNYRPKTSILPPLN